MTLDIIDDNYIRNHKYSKIWKGYIILISIIYLLQLLNLFELPKSYRTILDFAIGIIAIVSLINMFIFTRIGKLELFNNKILYQLYESDKVKELINIKSIKISNSQKSQYVLKIDNKEELLVEMKNGQLDQFKKICVENNIETITSSFIEDIKKWFNKS